MGKGQKYHKNNPANKTYWVETPDRVGEFLFSFDKKRIFNLYADYPWKLTEQEKALFDNENPEWAEYFKDRIYYGDLRNKSIFDFCDDEKLRKKIIGEYTEDYYMSFPKTVICEHLIEYAQITNNQELLDAAKALLIIAEKEWDKEAKRAMKKGLIID